MEFITRHIGSSRGFASNIIELTVTDNCRDSSITETITDSESRIDENFIMKLRLLADELEEQNDRLKT